MLQTVIVVKFIAIVIVIVGIVLVIVAIRLMITVRVILALAMLCSHADQDGCELAGVH